jgi:hypothetical protein
MFLSINYSMDVEDLAILKDIEKGYLPMVTDYQFSPKDVA